MKRLALYFGVLFILSHSACKKDKELLNEKEEHHDYHLNYAPQTKGSYWVYEKVIKKSSGSTSIYRDSISIIGDTIINSKKYAIKGIFGNDSILYRRTFFRDSSGFIINNYGDILYSYTHYLDTLYFFVDRAGNTSISIMGDSIHPIQTPAGNFRTLVNTNYFHSENGFPCDSDDVITPMSFYANNVGLVYKKSRYSLICDSIITKLIDYKINPVISVN